MARRGSRPRLTGGVARGQALVTPVPASARPTSSRVREALFSIVGHDLSGLTVLDAFGGSGLLGLEAWSRGATVTIVERGSAAVRAIRANAAGIGAEVRLLRGDVIKLAVGLEGVDGVLADPPYALDPAPILQALAPLAGRWLVLEVDATRTPLPGVGGLALRHRRCYGGTALWTYTREGA